MRVAFDKKGNYWQMQKPHVIQLFLEFNLPKEP